MPQSNAAPTARVAGRWGPPAKGQPPETTGGTNTKKPRVRSQCPPDIRLQEWIAGVDPRSGHPIQKSYRKTTGETNYNANEPEDNRRHKSQQQSHQRMAPTDTGMQPEKEMRGTRCASIRMHGDNRRNKQHRPTKKLKVYDGASKTVPPRCGGDL
jgi:hypothetical protein